MVLQFNCQNNIVNEPRIPVSPFIFTSFQIYIHDFQQRNCRGSEREKKRRRRKIYNDLWELLNNITTGITLTVIPNSAFLALVDRLNAQSAPVQPQSTLINILQYGWALNICPDYGPHHKCKETARYDYHFLYSQVYQSCLKCRFKKIKGLLLKKTLKKTLPIIYLLDLTFLQKLQCVCPLPHSSVPDVTLHWRVSQIIKPCPACILLPAMIYSCGMQKCN